MGKFLKKGLIFLILAAYLGIIPQGVRLFAADAAKPTVYICGDSTVQNYSASYAPQTGWGQVIPKYFTSDVLFVNKAIGGRSSKSFIVDGRLDEILKVIQPNDYLFVQFGHNDADISKPERYTEPNTEYKQYLRQYIDGARSKGAIPVLITPVARLNYTNGVFKNDFPAYCTAMKEVAVEKNVGCIDLMTKSINYYTSIGYNQVYPFYMVSSNGTDYTHFTDKGATQIARLVSEGVKGLNLAISKYVLSSSTTTPTNTINPTNTPTKAPVATPTNKPVETSTVILLPEDINGDNVVNMADVIMIARSFNSQVSETNKKCDLNMDGVINMSDVIKIAVKFNAVASTLPVSTIYQAEQANFSLGVVESINTGYTGSGYINYDNVTGSYIEWTVYAPAAGTYLLNFIYANGTTVNRPLEVKVNDGVVTGSLDFDSTGVWTTWKTTGINANLNAGNNLIRATAITANGGPNIDYLEVIK